MDSLRKGNAGGVLLTKLLRRARGSYKAGDIREVGENLFFLSRIERIDSQRM